MQNRAWRATGLPQAPPGLPKDSFIPGSAPLRQDGLSFHCHPGRNISSPQGEWGAFWNPPPLYCHVLSPLGRPGLGTDPGRDGASQCSHCWVRPGSGLARDGKFFSHRHGRLQPCKHVLQG